MEFWLINELDSPQITDFCLIEIETDFAAFPAQLLYTCRTASIFLAMATPGWFSPVPLPRARTCSRRRCMKWDLRNNCKALGSQLPGPQPSPRVHEELYPSWPAHGAITTRTALTVWTWGHLVEWSVWKQTALEPPQWPFNAAGVQQWRSGWGLPQTLAALGWSSARRGGWLGASTLQPPLFVFVPQGPNQEEERNRASAFWERLGLRARWDLAVWAGCAGCFLLVPIACLGRWHLPAAKQMGIISSWQGCSWRGAHAVLFPALRSARGFYCILEVYWVTETLLKIK